MDPCPHRIIQVLEPLPEQTRPYRACLWVLGQGARPELRFAAKYPRNRRGGSSRFLAMDPCPHRIIQVLEPLPEQTRPLDQRVLGQGARRAPLQGNTPPSTSNFF